MRRYKKNNSKKERIIMIASSAFVLAALTLTGVYMNEQSAELEDDGYTLDFTALEDGAEDKLEEIAEQKAEELYEEAEMVADAQNGMQKQVTEDDLDYMPLEVDSGRIEIPGLTNQIAANGGTGMAPLESELLTEEENLLSEVDGEAADMASADVAVAEASAEQISTTERTLSFSQEEGLLRPVSGEILMHYSMGNSIYFATLDQYKYNPAVILSSPVGTVVSACAEGKVIDISDDRVQGKMVTLDLGSGYQAYYGQLTDVPVSVGSYVDEGDVLGTVAEPTKYFSLEGSNLYFALKKDGAYVNPEVMFR